MKVIVPVEMKDSRLISTNIPEDDYDEYSSGTTYNEGDRVIVTTPNIHKIYECVSTDPVSGVYPPDDTSDPPKWLEVGATNRWRLFDAKIGSATSGEETFTLADYSVEGDNNSGIAYHLRPDELADSVSIFGVDALYFDIIIKVNGVTEYERRVLLGGSLENSNWYSYFFQPIRRVNQVVLTDLPLNQEKDIYISFVEPSSEDPVVGEVVIGRSYEIAKSLYGTSLGILDFSRKERDDFGNFQIIERGYADTMDVDMSILNEDITFVKRLLSDLRAKPAVYIAGECIEGTSVYGYYTDFSVTISGPERSDASITIEGLI